MKALIVCNMVHSVFYNHTFTQEQLSALATWNNGNPAPDAIVTVPAEWEQYINETFTWAPETGLVEPEPGYVLGRAKAQKFAEFDTLFARLDALKIRPAASIAEASAAGEPIPQGDAYRLSELEAIAAENRDLRETVAAAETVEAVRAVSVWWPEE